MQATKTVARGCPVAGRCLWHHGCGCLAFVGGRVDRQAHPPTNHLESPLAGATTNAEQQLGALAASRCRWFPAVQRGTRGELLHSCGDRTRGTTRRRCDDCALARTYRGRTSYARGLKSKPGSHIDCRNGGAPRGAWPCPARIWRNRHQRCGTRVDLETAGNFFPGAAESSLDLSWAFPYRLGVGTDSPVPFVVVLVAYAALC